MRTKSNRVENFRALVKDRSLHDVASEVGSSYQNLWQILGGTKLPSGLTRGIGDKLARKIEVAFKLDPAQGWKVRDHFAPRFE